MNRLILLLLAAVLLAGFPLMDAFGRGFGGFRAGGLGGGGYAGFRGGGIRAGGFDAGGLGGFRAGGLGGARYDEGGFRDRMYHPDTTRNYSGDGWRDRTGYDRDRTPDTFRGREDGGVSRNQLDRFLGMPTDAGLGRFGPERDRAGVEGTHIRAGRVEGPLGGSAAFMSGTHVSYVRPEVRANQGWLVRNNFNRYNLFTPGWFSRHPHVWAYGGLIGTAWASASWFDVADWLGWDSMPEDYDYGSTVLYTGDNVYVEGQAVGSPVEYYDQASSLAAAGAATQDDQAAQWMPLGVFGLVQGDQANPTMVFQLSINRQGIVRGNCYNTLTDATLPVRGSVDKKTQRVAWTVGDNKNTVFDTGLYNLTKDEAPALVHFGKDSTQEWLMVRLQGKAEAQSDS
jgi:hypothetical protein